MNKATPSHCKYLRKNKAQLRDLIREKSIQLGVEHDAMKFYHWDKNSLAMHLDSLTNRPTETPAEIADNELNK